MFERRLYFHIDWLLLGAVLLLAAIGVSMIYSTTYVTLPDGTGHAGPRFWVQLYAVGIGILAMLVCLALDYRFLAEHSLALFAGLVLLLVYVLVAGKNAGGSTRWISLGSFNLQPSEFGRLALALTLAMYFGENRRGAKNTGDLVVAGVFFVIPFLLVAKQPDLGTAVTLVPVAFGIAYLAGLRFRLIAIVAVAGVLLAPVAWKVALKDYQKSRIQTFIDPEKDPRNKGYQQIQARVTVGSGGLTGKGFRKGTQGQYKFLPVADNDFIFSVLAEEQGFIGVLVALGLYLFVILRSHRVGPARQGPHRCVSRRRHHFRLCFPGDLQRHDVGRARARQGANAAPHELRRLVDDRDPRRVRADPERPHAAIYELRLAVRGSRFAVR